MSLLKVMDWGSRAAQGARPANRRGAGSPADDTRGGFDAALAAQWGQWPENRQSWDSGRTKADKSSDSRPEKSAKERAADDHSQGQPTDVQTAGQAGAQSSSGNAQNTGGSAEGSDRGAATETPTASPASATAKAAAGDSASAAANAEKSHQHMPGKTLAATGKKVPEAIPQAGPDGSAPEPAEDANDSSTVATPPPLLAAQEGQQAHEPSRHAAHVKALELDTAAAEPGVTPSAPAPALPAAVAEAAGAEGALPVVPLKVESGKGAGAPGMPLIAGEAKAGSTGAAGAESARAAQETPPADAPDPMDQVVLGLKGKLDARTGKAEIRLDPPNLGVVKVSVTLENGILTAEFQSGSGVVRDLLKGNLDKLKTALQGQGVAVDRLAVEAPPSGSDTGTASQNPQASFGSAAHDGRSAGQHQSDPRAGHQRSGGEGFARVFTQAQEAPLDLVA